MQAAEIESNSDLTRILCRKWAECHAKNTPKCWQRMIGWLDGASDCLCDSQGAQMWELIMLFDMAFKYAESAEKTI